MVNKGTRETARQANAENEESKPLVSNFGS